MRLNRKFVLLLLATLPESTAFGQAPRVLDDFDNAAAWEVAASDQVTGQLRTVDADGGKALCLDYDFHGVSGYVGIRRKLALDYPANYAFDLRIRGSGPRNDLQFKLVDAGGDNVWWVRKPLFALPDAWTPLQFRKRHVSKAWGPSPDTELAHSAMLEFTLASGEGVRLVFADRSRDAMIDGPPTLAPRAPAAPPAKPVRPAKPASPPSNQGDLF